MDKKKVILLVSLGVVLIGGGITTVVILSKRKKEKDAEKLRIAKQKQFEKEKREQYQQSYKGEGAPQGSVASGSTGDPNISQPFIDSELQLANPFSEIKGQSLYPRTTQRGSGYANIRKGPEVLEAWEGWRNNRITKINAPTPIGRVISEKEDDLDPPMRWFKVQLANPCCGILSDYKTGWVRADTITMRPYNKKYEIEMSKFAQSLKAKYPNWWNSTTYRREIAKKSTELRQKFPVPYSLYRKYGVPAPKNAPKA